MSMAIGPAARVVAPTPPTLAEAKQAIIAGDGPAQDGVGTDGCDSNHAWDMDFVDARGRAWRGHFACHVLTYREKIQVGLMRAKLSAGVPPGMLDVLTGNLLEILAHLSVALDEAPPWASNLEGLHDTAVVQTIYEEVAAHEARFHGPRRREPSEPDGGSPQVAG